MNTQASRMGTSCQPSPAYKGTGLPVNIGRKRFTIQNQSTDVLLVKLGGDASPRDFHISLHGCVRDCDGTGGIFSIDGYQGEVSVHGMGVVDYTVIEYI